MSTMDTEKVIPITAKQNSVEPYSWNKPAVRDPKSGRIVGFSDLNARQRAFVRFMVETGGNANQAAKLSGYSDAASSVAGLMANPRVIEAINTQRIRALESLACRAVGVLREVMDDTGAPASARVQAARLSLSLVGHAEAGQARTDAPSTAVPLESMSVDALEAFVAGGLSAIQRLRPVIEAQAAEVKGVPGPS